MEKFLNKIASRKFLLCVAAFIATFCTGVAGIIPQEWMAIGMSLSAGIYAACEAAVDRASLMANQTVNTTTKSVNANVDSTTTANKILGQVESK